MGLQKYFKRFGHNVEIISSEMFPIIPVRGMKSLSFSFFSSIKGFFSTSEYDVIHAHNIPSIFPALSMQSKKKILTVHGIYSEQVGILHGSVIGNAIQPIELKLIGKMNLITAVSKAVADHYVRLGFTVEYIPNGVDLEQLPLTGIRKAERQAIFVGRLSKEKGIDVLIDSFKKKDVQDIRLLIVGEGPELQRLKRIASDMHNIDFLGPRDHESTLRLIKGSDVLILPSLVEGLSTVILEAMALKVPVIATAVGGNIELVDDGVTGFIVEPNNSTALSSAIVRLLELNDRGSTLAGRAFEMILKKYSMESVARRYLDIFERTEGT